MNEGVKRGRRKRRKGGEKGCETNKGVWCRCRGGFGKWMDRAERGGCRVESGCVEKRGKDEKVVTSVVTDVFNNMTERGE